MSTELSEKKVIELLLPKVKKAIKDVLSDSIAEKIPSLKDTIENSLWDKTVAELGRQLSIPPEIVKKLQKIDDIVREVKSNSENTINELSTRIEQFKERLKDVDLNKTVTMSYKELQDTIGKSSKNWGIVSFLLGFASGIVTVLKFLLII